MESPVPDCAVLVPVLKRPHLVKPLIDALERSVVQERLEGWHVELVFVCTPGDRKQIAAVRLAGLEPLVVAWPAGAGDYARKINHAASACDATWLLTGADDLRFHSGWLRACVSRHIETGALVIGTNDLHNPTVVRGITATHLLVHRDYLARGTIDEPGRIFHEGYDHNCVDSEAVETAKVRGMFAFARDAHVEHLHHSFRQAPDDATYRKGRALHRQDRVLFAKRRRLWSGTAVERRRLRSVRAAGA